MNIHNNDLTDYFCPADYSAFKVKAGKDKRITDKSERKDHKALRSARKYRRG